MARRRTSGSDRAARQSLTNNQDSRQDSALQPAKNQVLGGAAVYRCGRALFIIAGFSPRGAALEFFRKLSNNIASDLASD